MSDKTTERSSNIRTLRRVAPYLWPKGEGWVKRRVVLSLTALLIARLVSVSTPFFYKAAVDSLG
ncbi:MAG: metal ABC transporter permease, partial [Rhodobacteraceae bacterium]|nr:metal ABC transporter permease [Paracoccaceae bacterium]MCB2159973.1 metal ABC transporter permease [Paracoccaceae bacterium]